VPRQHNTNRPRGPLLTSAAGNVIDPAAPHPYRRGGAFSLSVSMSDEPVRLVFASPSGEVMAPSPVAMFDSSNGYRRWCEGWVTRRSSRGDAFSFWLPPMPRIPDEYLDCVIYLYASEQDAESGARSGGSGFLVGVPTTDLPTNFWFLYAVTARHIIEKGDVVIRMKTIEGGNAIWPTDERAWTWHPAGDDLAVCLISFEPCAHKFQFIRRADFIDKATITAMNVGPGDEAFVVGRFINHEGKQQNLPTVRFGCIGQMPGEPIKQDTGFAQESFLVEARSIGGYSGSPVFVFIPIFSERAGVQNWAPDSVFQNRGPYGFLKTHGPWLLGVDWGYINDWTPLCDAAGKPVDRMEPSSRQVKMNTGMMAVVPAWKLAELLDEGPVAEHRRMLIEQARHGMESNPTPATSD